MMEGGTVSHVTVAGKQGLPAPETRGLVDPLAQKSLVREDRTKRALYSFARRERREKAE